MKNNIPLATHSSHSSNPRSSSSAFTLIEMLVVIAIIALLAAIISPVLAKSMERGKKVKCLMNTRQISLAANLLFSDLGNDLPVISGCDKSGEMAFLLMQYMNESTAVFNCPSNPGDLTQKYKSVIKDEDGEEIGIMEYAINNNMTICNGQIRRKQYFIDNHSEVAFASDTPWHHANAERPHDGGANVAYLDGHAAWLPDELMSEDGIPATWQDADFWKKGHSMPGR